MATVYVDVSNELTESKDMSSPELACHTAWPKPSLM